MNRTYTLIAYVRQVKTVHYMFGIQYKSFKHERTFVTKFMFQLCSCSSPYYVLEFATILLDIVAACAFVDVCEMKQSLNVH